MIQDTTSYIPTIVGTFIIFYFLNTNIGGHLLQSLVLSLVGLDNGGPSYQAGVASSATSGIRAIVEAIKRGSYSLLFSSIAGIGIISGLRRKELEHSVIVATLSGIATIGLFLGLAVFSPGGIGLFRILSFAPVLSLPAAAYGIEYLDENINSKTKIVTFIGVLVLSAGIGVAFVTPTTGGIEFTANSQQVAASDWIVMTQPSDVVGSRSTFNIILGRHGPSAKSRLSSENLSDNQVTYSWVQTDPKPGTLYVVDDPAVALTHVDASEGIKSPLRCLSSFRIRQGKIYDNGGADIYRKSTPQSNLCYNVG
ncbi:hypothetical protein [Haladaptatus sp. CMAA 1911]